MFADPAAETVVRRWMLGELPVLWGERWGEWGKGWGWWWVCWMVVWGAGVVGGRGRSVRSALLRVLLESLQ